jgi:hypothetical protein
MHSIDSTGFLPEKLVHDPFVKDQSDVIARVPAVALRDFLEEARKYSPVQYSQLDVVATLRVLVVP